MFNAAHVLETALLILAAFLIGATVGTLARLALRRPQRTPVVVALPDVASASSEPPVAEAPALVTAPTIEPLPKPVTQVVPADIPTPDFAEIIQPALPESAAAAERPAPVAPTATGAAMAPARVAGQTTSGKLVPAPIHDEPKRAAASGAPSAEVIPFPSIRVTAAAAEKVEAPAGVELPIAAPEATAAPKPEDVPEPVAAEAVVPAATEVEPDQSANPAPAIEPAPAPAAEPPAVAAAATVPPPSAENDEAAAMRAIEGNWSPRRRQPARRAEPAPAEAAAPAPPPPVELPGKPVGLEAPRAGGKDDLTHVIGVLPIIETALNSIGVYHFDQLAAFTDENVGWLETHLGIEGRIGREHWREQARELALASVKAAKAANQQ